MSNGTDSENQRKALESATRENGIWRVIKSAYINLTNLTVTTEVTGGAAPCKIVTEIDLIGADRRNSFAVEFLKDEKLARLKEFHKEQVELAEKDLNGKVEFLERLGRHLAGLVSRAEEKPETSEEGPAPDGEQT